MESRKKVSAYQPFDIEEDSIAGEPNIEYSSKKPNGNSKDEKIKAFQIRLLKGKISQLIVENTFNTFKYQTFAMGYENLIDSETLSKLDLGTIDDNTTKLRINPDILVFDKNKRILIPIEVKSIFKEGRNDLSITKVKFELYCKNWPNAILAIFNYNSFRICCEEFSKVKAIESRQNKNEVLIDCTKLKSLSHFFPDINDSLLNKYLEEISMEVFKRK